MKRTLTLTVELDATDWEAWRWFKDHYCSSEATHLPGCTYGLPSFESREDARQNILYALYCAKEAPGDT